MADEMLPPTVFRLPGCGSAPEHDWRLHWMQLLRHDETGELWAVLEILRCSHCALRFNTMYALEAAPQ